MQVPIKMFMGNVLSQYLIMVKSDLQHNTTKGEKMFKLMKESLFWFNNAIVGILTLPLQDISINENIHMPSREEDINTTDHTFSVDKLKNIEIIRDDHFINHMVEVNKNLNSDDIMVSIMGSRHKQYEKWEKEASFAKKIMIDDTHDYDSWKDRIKKKVNT